MKLNVVQCSFARGGLFNSTISATWDSPLVPAAAEDRLADNGALTVAAFGTDQISLSDKLGNLTNFSFFKPNAGEDQSMPGNGPDDTFPGRRFRAREKPISADLPQSALGLGRNSTFLESLYYTGKIPSRTWSLFSGLEGADAADTMDGAIAFNGYDKAKTVGRNMTRPFSSLANMALCPGSFIVSVTDILVKYSNGTATSLFRNATNTAMRACIKPDTPLIDLPTNLWHAFQGAIGGTFIGPGGTSNGQSSSYKGWGMEYATQCVFSGDLQFVLDSELEITVPNSQLVVPDVHINNDEQLYIPTNEIREILVGDVDRGRIDNMLQLGQVFLNSVCLHVDNEREHFTLWQANLTASEDLVAVPGIGPGPCDPPPPHPESPAIEPQPISLKEPLSARQIAGITVGAVSGLAIVLGIMCLCLHGGGKRVQAPEMSEPQSLQPDTYKETVFPIHGPGHLLGRLWHMQPSTASGRSPLELEGAQVHELYTSDTPPRLELDASVLKKMKAFQ